MPATIHSCPPSVIEAGETVQFYFSSRFSTTLYTAKLVLNNGVCSPIVVVATVSNSKFLATLTADQTAGLKEGRYSWAELFTLISDTTVKSYGAQGYLAVLANPFLIATPSDAQKNVTAINAALLKIGGSQFSTASFNGQTFSRSSADSLQKLLVFWMARVAAEKAEQERLRGNHHGGLLAPEFVPIGGHQAAWPMGQSLTW